MSKYFKPISISLSPNVERDDLHLALNLLIRPWLWRKGKAVKELEESFKNYLGVRYAVSFNSGRSSLYAILKALEVEKGGEVLLQAFTCNAVPNPVLWAGLEPIYVDCNKDDFNMSVSDLEAKIRPNSKVVIVQHTFGLPADMDAIRALCAKYNLILIEDCAHSLGAEYNGIKVGSHSKAAFFSFSRDKAISSVYGGMAVTNDEKLGEALRQAQGKMGFPNPFWTMQQILHPILLHYFILPVYNFLDLGKIMLVLSQWFHVLSKAVSWQEKRGLRPDYFPKALPNAMAMMAVNQLGKIEKFNTHRKLVSDYYYKMLAGGKFQLPKKFDGRKSTFLRFTVKHKEAHEIIYESWHKQNILLGDWYTTPIAPFDTKIEDIKYTKGSCQNAEDLAKITLNLPTHINISQKDAERIINFLKKWN
ncbi:MAG: aminotransferase class I/II-fold pyridoxal phosphate-dependent enzyme [Candidatus Staskawiczbacteria bacterium]|nr:aminotransferase class I/II-fold pyridoxal phosphate-dependent enzyme [Candidatus Staskawiczbacteria bacterium]